MSDQETCSRQILEVIPGVMRAIRTDMRANRGSDLTVPQFRSLAFLDHCSGCSLSDLAEHLGLTPPSTCKLVDGLVARGLVMRQEASGDRRRVALTLTSAGSTILGKTLQGAESTLASRLAGLNPEDCLLVQQALDILRPLFNHTEMTELNPLA